MGPSPPAKSSPLPESQVENLATGDTSTDAAVCINKDSLMIDADANTGGAIASSPGQEIEANKMPKPQSSGLARDISSIKKLILQPEWVGTSRKNFDRSVQVQIDVSDLNPRSGMCKLTNT
jgi:hypothetical protein